MEFPSFDVKSVLPKIKQESNRNRSILTYIRIHFAISIFCVTRENFGCFQGEVINMQHLVQMYGVQHRPLYLLPNPSLGDQEQLKNSHFVTEVRRSFGHLVIWSLKSGGHERSNRQSQPVAQHKIFFNGVYLMPQTTRFKVKVQPGPILYIQRPQKNYLIRSIIFNACEA